MPGNWSDFGGLVRIAYNFDLKMRFGLPELSRNYFHVLVEIVVLAQASRLLKRCRLTPD